MPQINFAPMTTSNIAANTIPTTLVLSTTAVKANYTYTMGSKKKQEGFVKAGSNVTMNVNSQALIFENDSPSIIVGNY